MRKINKNNILKGFGFIILIFFAVSCNKPNDNDQDEYGLFTKMIVVDGTIRRYAMYLPKDINNLSVPLVFVLHGGSGNIENMTGENGYKAPFKIWMNIADEEKIIIIYPEGLNGSSGKPTWNDCRANCIVNSDADDIRFITTLIDEIKINYNIAPTRVYATGFSNGGLLSLRLAVKLSDKIAAVAAISAAMPDTSKCGQPTNPVSILFMNGTNDSYLPYAGGTIGNPPNPDHGSVCSTETSINFWVNFNQTESTPTTHTFSDIDNTDGGIVESYVYSNGLEEIEVVLYKINGGGHLAPSKLEQYSNLTEQIFGKQNHDIEMTTEVWNFFKDKTLN